MKKIRANVCAVTHAGRIRRENEDNYNLNGRMTSTGDLRKGSAFVQTMAEPFHLSVCDGMGGESYGELASGIAVETIAAHAANVYESGEDYSFAISNCLDDANNRICAEINARGKRMGTTLAAIYAVKGKIICTNIGDTRVYHYSKGVLEQISFDHTHAQTIVDAGEAMQNDIGRIPDAKRLTKHLGVFPEEASLSPNISVIDDVDNGDIILLCSDGLTDMLSDEDITAILSTGESAQDVASKLIRSALEKGGKDNVTVMAALLDVEETAVFAPIAAAMVGDKDADYEEEYRNSFGFNQVPYDENPVSPYANADARAYSKPVDKAKIIKIVGIVIGAVIVALIVALFIKALVNGGNVEEETTTTTYNYYDYTTYPDYYYTTNPPITTWVFESTSESETSETTTETTTRRITTKRTTKRTTKKNTTKKNTTKKPATTTANRVTTTAVESGTTVPSTTLPAGETTTNTATTVAGGETTTTVSDVTSTTGSDATSATSSANTSETTSQTTAQTSAETTSTTQANGGNNETPAENPNGNTSET